MSKFSTPKVAARKAGIANPKTSPKVAAEKAPDTRRKTSPKVAAEKAPDTRRKTALKVAAEKAPDTRLKTAPKVVAEKAPDTHPKTAPKVAAEKARDTYRKTAPRVVAGMTRPTDPKIAPRAAAGMARPTDPEIAPKAAAGMARPTDPEIATQFDEFRDTRVPDSMRALAERNVAQTRELYERSANALQAVWESWERSLDAAGQGAVALNRKIIDIAARNISTGFDLATSLARAKNLAEAVEVQAAYWRKQFGELRMQAEEVRALSTKVTANVAEPIKAQATHSINESTRHKFFE
jgi:hypothetical protein